jgi:hypothetical protein
MRSCAAGYVVDFSFGKGGGPRQLSSVIFITFIR